MKVEIIPPAEEDIKEIYYYILNQYKAPLTAEKFLDGIKAAIDTLKAHPNRGAHYGSKYRKIFYKHYKIIYYVENEKVYVVAVG